MIFSKNYWVVYVVFVVFEKLSQLRHWLLWWVGLFHELFVFKIAQISQKYFLTSSVLTVHGFKGCEVEKVVGGAITVEVFVHDRTGVNWKKVGQWLFFRLMMDFALIGGQGLGMFVVKFVGELLISKKFFVIGFGLEQLLHPKIKFEKTTFSIELLYCILHSLTKFWIQID